MVSSSFLRVNEQIGPTTKADLLRVAPVLVQRSVLDQGSLATCRDPNAGCVGRIRKAERAERREGSVAPGFVAPSRDEPWLEEWGTARRAMTLEGNG